MKPRCIGSEKNPWHWTMNSAADPGFGEGGTGGGVPAQLGGMGERCKLPMQTSRNQRFFCVEPPPSQKVRTKKQIEAGELQMKSSVYMHV